MNKNYINNCTISTNLITHVILSATILIIIYLFSSWSITQVTDTRVKNNPLEANISNGQIFQLNPYPSPIKTHGPKPTGLPVPYPLPKRTSISQSSTKFNQLDANIQIFVLIYIMLILSTWFVTTVIRNFPQDYKSE
jgi:hypothetical protein